MIFYGIFFFPDTGSWTSIRFTSVFLALLLAGMSIEGLILARHSAPRWMKVVGGASVAAALAAGICFLGGIELAGHLLLVVGALFYLATVFHQFAERGDRKAAQSDEVARAAWSA